MSSTEQMVPGDVVVFNDKGQTASITGLNEGKSDKHVYTPVKKLGRPRGPLSPWVDRSRYSAAARRSWANLSPEEREKSASRYEAMT